MLFGIHPSKSEALEVAKRFALTAIQLFQFNPKLAQAPSLQPDPLPEQLSAEGIFPICHSSYTTCLGTARCPNPTPTDPFIQSIVRNHILSIQSGYKAHVYHVSSGQPVTSTQPVHRPNPRKPTIEPLAQTHDRLLSQLQAIAMALSHSYIQSSNPFLHPNLILLENRANGKSAFGRNLATLTTVIAAYNSWLIQQPFYQPPHTQQYDPHEPSRPYSNPLRVGICLDLAHAYGAGYDLNSPTSRQSLYEDLTSIINYSQPKTPDSLDQLIPSTSPLAINFETIHSPQVDSFLRLIHFNFTDPGVYPGSGLDRHDCAPTESPFTIASAKSVLYRLNSIYQMGTSSNLNLNHADPAFPEYPGQPFSLPTICEASTPSAILQVSLLKDLESRLTPYIETTPNLPDPAQYKQAPATVFDKESL